MRPKETLQFLPNFFFEKIFTSSHVQRVWWYYKINVLFNFNFYFGKSPPKLAPRFPLLPLPLFSNKAVISLRFQRGGERRKEFQSGEITFPPPPPTFFPLLLGIEQGKGGTELNFMLFLFLLQYGPMPFSPPPPFSPGGRGDFFSLRENERCGWVGGGFEKEEGAGGSSNPIGGKVWRLSFFLFVLKTFFRRSYMTRTSLFLL